jgi:DMSO/TMAO reductase YedYZ molybdopterin-dependent catalytic subunit
MSKRKFLKISIKFITGIGLLASPLFSLIRLAQAKVQKMILPKDFPRVNLINKNPANLDTHKLNITPLKDFETMGITDHETDLDAWRLKVEGLVERPIQLTYSQILSFPAIERNVLQICPGVFANHGRWKGISMPHLFEKAKFKNEAVYVTFRGPEGNYEKTERFPLKDVLSDKIFLAYEVNGKPLPKKHGFPLRVVAKEHYGFRWVKYVHKISID